MHTHTYYICLIYACNACDFDWPSVNTLTFTQLTQCHDFKQKTISLIEINVTIFFCTFFIFTCQSLSQACVCKGRTSAKFVSIPQIILNNDILMEENRKLVVVAFCFR